MYLAAFLPGNHNSVVKSSGIRQNNQILDHLCSPAMQHGPGPALVCDWTMKKRDPCALCYCKHVPCKQSLDWLRVLILPAPSNLRSTLQKDYSDEYQNRLKWL